MMNSFTVPLNQRSNPRYNVSKDARVIYPDERGCVEVLISEMSTGGARVKLKASTDLSGSFNLFIPSEKLLYTAAVRWMKGDLVGIQFVRSPKDATLKIVS